MRSDEERQLKSLGWLKKALEQNGPKKWERWSQQENGKAAKENGKAGQASKRQMVGLDLGWAGRPKGAVVVSWSQ